MGLPLNLNGQSHFLVPDKLSSASHLYFLYFPPLSQPNITYATTFFFLFLIIIIISYTTRGKGIIYL